MTKKELPTCPDFNILNKQENIVDNRSNLKEGNVFYILNFKENSIHYKHSEIKEVQKKLKDISNSYKKNKKTTKSPFVILEMEHKKIKSPTNLNKEKEDKILTNVNTFEKTLDDSLGDLAVMFQGVFKKR